MHEITSIKSALNIYFYYFDDDINMNNKSHKYISSSLEKYNGNYDLIKSVMELKGQEYKTIYIEIL